MLEIIIPIVLIIISLLLLGKGASILIEGAADIARSMRISPIIVGLTIVAIGTSLPEFIVTFFSSLLGKGDISLGNIIGSNILNIALIIGISAVLTPLVIRSKTLTYEFPFLIISSFLLLILANNHFIHSQSTFSLGRIDGLLFLLILGLFLWYILRTIKRNSKKSVKKEFSTEYKHENPSWKNVLYIFGGIFGLVIGAKVFLTNAEKIALSVGISDAFIGLVLASVGTSLPELAASTVAAWKKRGDIAVGNIVGSNIFNILFVVGATSIIRPINVSPSLLATDAIIMIIITLFFLLFAATDKKITRKEGIILIIFYAAYFIFLIWRL